MRRWAQQVRIVVRRDEAVFSGGLRGAVARSDGAHHLPEVKVRLGHLPGGTPSFCSVLRLTPRIAATSQGANKVLGRGALRRCPKVWTAAIGVQWLSYGARLGTSASRSSYKHARTHPSH